MVSSPPSPDEDAEKQSKVKSAVASEISPATLGAAGEESGSFGLSTTAVLLLGMLTLLIMCVLVGLMWFLAELGVTPPDLYYGDYDVDESSGASEDNNYEHYDNNEGSEDSTDYGNYDHYHGYVDPDDAEYSGGKMNPLTVPGILITLRPARITTPTVSSLMTTTRRTSTPGRTTSSTSQTSASTVTNLNPCTTADCRRQSDYLKLQLNFSARPCQDFYAFACGNYKGHPDGPYYEVEQASRTITISTLKSTPVPAVEQSAWEKAAGIFQTCITFSNSQTSEFAVLKSWMVFLKLDPLNLTASRTLDPVDMVVRLALDLGVPAVFDLKLSNSNFIGAKRAMQFGISDMRERWLEIRDAQLSKKNGSNRVRRFYSHLLSSYPGYISRRHKKIAQMLHDYDEALITAVRRHVNGSASFITAAIRHMGDYTSPQITTGQWSGAVARYTNGTYKGRNKIRFQKELLQALAQLLAASSWGLDGLRAVLSWSLLQGLNSYTSAAHLVPVGTDSQDFCYDHVLDVMDFAVTTRYLRSKVTKDAMTKAAVVFSNVSEAFVHILRKTTWLNEPARHVALQKLFKMKADIGGPGQRLDEAFVNKYYECFPDVPPTDRFLETWLKVRSARAHQKWADQTNVFFNMSGATVYYVYNSNRVVAPAGGLQPVFFYEDGNPALNYGSLGTSLAHRIMNAYDAIGIQYDDNGNLTSWITAGAQARLANSALCLRQSHKGVSDNAADDY